MDIYHLLFAFVAGMSLIGWERTRRRSRAHGLRTVELQTEVNAELRAKLEYRDALSSKHPQRVYHDKEYDITDMVRRAHEIAVDRGWWPEEKLERVRDGDPDVTAAQLALIHSEVSEALEDLRVGNMTTTFRADGKPEGFDSELADIVIRVLDLAGARGIDLAQEVGRKMEFNKTRTHRHGGKAI